MGGHHRTGDLSRHGQFLALRFDVTPQTIRKDLNELCEGRLLARTHGGAAVASGVENVAYEARRQLAAREKVVIGHRAADLIPNNCSLFINIGTTTEEVARALVHHEGLLVITNNIHVATTLAPCPKIDVIVGARNLLDQKYQLVDGFPEEGRNFRADLRVKF